MRCWNSHPSVCHCGPRHPHNGVNVDAAILAWNEEVAIAMPPARPVYQQRVIDEKAEMDDRLTKLSAFIDAGKGAMQTVPAEEFVRMLVQSGIMKEYSEILGERIAAFPPPPGGPTPYFTAHPQESTLQYPNAPSTTTNIIHTHRSHRQAGQTPRRSQRIRQLMGTPQLTGGRLR